jgi:hypothetical protein
MEVSGQFHTPAALLPRKESQVLITQVSGWDPEVAWTWHTAKREITALAGNENIEVQPVAVHFIDCVVPTDGEISVPNLMCYPVSMTNGYRPHSRVEHNDYAPTAGTLCRPWLSQLLLYKHVLRKQEQIKHARWSVFIKYFRLDQQEFV